MFPESFADLTEAQYESLVGRREARQFYSGALYRLRAREGVGYGFDVIASTADDIAEALTAREVRFVYDSLRDVFRLEPLVYYPRSSETRAIAVRWRDSGFPISMAPFRRGDVSADGSIDVTDVVVLLDDLFARGPELPCLAAGDTNEDGELDVSDAVTLLFYLFLGRRPLDPPFEHCGWDPTPSPLGCLTFPACAE